MRLHMRYWGLLLLMTGVLLVSLSGCGAATAPAPTAGDREEVLVVASIGPLGYFARRAGGDRVRVEVLVPPGGSPHTFEPTPAQLRLLQEADVLVLNGVGLEFWADKLIKSVDNPNLHVVTTAAGLDILQTGDEEDTEVGNPHVWLDPVNAAIQTMRIRDALVAVDPAGQPIYDAQTGAFIEELKALDREIMLTVDRFPTKKFIAFHAAWVYFARRYGLEQAAVVESTPGQEPSPADIALIVEVAREINARAIFAEPQLSPKAAQVIAEEAGLEVLFLDPLGTPPDYDYLRTMRHNLEQLKAGMGE